MKLEGTAALVTGGAKRVGRAIVMELARAGCDVAVHFRASRPEAEALAAEIASLGRRAIAVPGDLHDPATWPQIVQRAVDEFGRLDVLVNSASAFRAGQGDALGDFDPRRWESMIRVNAIAPVGLAHHAAAHLKRRGGGKIVNLCDISAERPWPDHLAYCTSKAALVAATKGLARALAPSVQVNGIAPGIALFPDDYTEETRRKLVHRVPLGREGTAEEVAGLVRFLVESGDYITGQIIPIDGGRSLA